MKAGVDIGSSLVKAVWIKEEGYKLFSTADTPLEEIAQELKEDGIKRINVVGIGSHADYFKDFDIKTTEGDKIENEVRLQARGVKKMLENPDISFLLVSIGTGTSYTLVKGEKVIRFPLGNSISGGYINGLGKVLGMQDYNELVKLSAASMPLDLCVKDMIPEKAGTFEGELIIANFGKGTADSEKGRAYASVVSSVAVTSIRDIMLMNMMPAFQPPKDIVYIGSTVSRTPLLKNLLNQYSIMIGKNPHFPKNGEFALAMGAYHMEE